MTRIREGRIVWEFKTGWWAVKYDDWAFYRNQFQRCAERSRAVDILALSPKADTLWLIEAKNYRRNARDSGKGPLPSEVAKKVRDTLAGLLAAVANAVNDEQAFAKKAVKAKKLRVVLHLEQPTTTSKLFQLVVDPADAQSKLKQLLKAIDPHPKVVSTETPDLDWDTSWSPPAPEAQ